MTDFDTEQHPRHADSGRFAQKPHSAPEVALGASSDDTDLASILAAPEGPPEYGVGDDVVFHQQDGQQVRAVVIDVDGEDLKLQALDEVWVAHRRYVTAQPATEPGRLRIGAVVRDPDTGVEYRYRPDLSPEAPFMHAGEFFTLAGVDEQVVG